MPNLEQNPNFLKQKYNLHNTAEVKSASNRTEVRSGEKVSQKPSDQIQNYLDRFKEILDRKDEGDREMGIRALKKIMYNKFVIKEEDFPESYFKNQQRLAREQGYGDVEIEEEQKAQMKEVAITDQKGSLDNWIDYLSSSDAIYPDWLKYYTFRSITQLGKYDKDKKEFAKRTKETTEVFPDLNREALAYVLDEIQKKYENQNNQKEILDLKKQEIEEDNNLSPEEKKQRIKDQEEFNTFLQGENFAKLYSFAINKVTPESRERLENITGQWIKYNQNSDHMPLVKSLQGHGTGWCTAGESTAQTQLQNGDFYVYYSNDEKNSPKIPRVAIRMEGDNIAEIRGIAPDQNMDEHIMPVVDEKLKEFGSEGERYKKKSANMKRLTEIENKIKKQEELNKEDLKFLYEMDDKIEGFGYKDDPRIKELRETRKVQKDLSIIFNCEPQQIAISKEEVINNNDIKVYVGPFFKELINRDNIEYIYTKFPEQRIEKFNLTIGEKSKKQIQQELDEREKIKDYNNPKQITNYVQGLLNHENFKINPEKKELKLIKLSLTYLGFSNRATWKEIIAKGEELGLTLCPPEVGLLFRLKYQELMGYDQPKKEWVTIFMNPISDPDGHDQVFDVTRSDDGERNLYSHWAGPDGRFTTAHCFLFSRK